MRNEQFDKWCSAATWRIQFPPDQEAVYEELMQHLRDRQADLMAQGMDEETAAQAAVASMGDAKEIAPQLAALHKPFWGFFVQITNRLLIAAAIVCVIMTFFFVRNQNTSKLLSPDVKFQGHENYTIVIDQNPDISLKCDSYTYTMNKVKLMEGPEDNRLFFNISRKGATAASELRYVETNSYGMQYLWAEDDLGNKYYSFAEAMEGDLTVQAWRTQTGYFTTTFEYWINDLPEGITWLDVHFGRDGRDLVMRIWLQGGDGQ